MKEILYSVFAIIITLTFVLKPENRFGLVGTWEASGEELEFTQTGKCSINGKGAYYRVCTSDRIRIYTDSEILEYTYLLSFGGESMYFGLKRYERVHQSGAEISIMEFLL